MKKPDLKKISTDIRSKILLRWPSLSYGALPMIIFILISVASIAGYVATTANLEGSRGRSIDRRFRENALHVNAVFDSYAHLLWASSGLMQSGTIDHDAWEKFISVYDAGQNYRAMEAIGVSYGTKPRETSLAYASPETPTTLKLIGVNMALSPSIVPSLEESAVSGMTTMTGTLPNLFSTRSTTASPTNGFLMVTPFYDPSLPHTNPTERSQALRGYTVAMFRGDVFFDSVFRDVDLTHTDLKVYLGDVKAENLQYQTNQATDADRRTRIQTLSEYGKKVTLVYSFDTAEIVPFSLTYFPQFLLYGGLAVGILIAGIAGYLLRSRYRELVYQNEREVNFAKDELLSLASHQLRTPATGVKQYLGMVLQGFAGDLNDQQRAYLERAYSSNNRQLHVINDILHLAKLEAGRIVLAEHKFDIADMVREVVDEQKGEAKKGEVKLTLQSPPRGLIIGDSHMLRMVAENLVNNAIKYTQPGGTVSVRLVQRGKSWVLTVKDTGVGIADKDLHKLFKQFSRINNSRSDFVTGTGIGLYLSHHLVVLHGGTIGVSSSMGHGSTFTVRLPRKM